MKKLMTLICAFQFVVVWAQEPVKDTFVIYYDKDVQVDTAERAYKYQPNDIRDFNVKVTPQDYSAENFKIKLEDENPTLKMYKVKPAKQSALLGNYVKAGYGPIYSTPYLETHFNSKRNKNFQYGVFYNHLSSAKGPVGKKNSGNSLNDFSVYGKKFGDKVIWSGELNYSRRRFNYYGYDDNLNVPGNSNAVRDSIKQVYNEIQAKVGFKQYDTSSVFNYDVRLSFRNLSDIDKAKEMQIGAEMDLSYGLAHAEIIMPTDVFVTKYQNGILNLNRNFVNIKPQFKKVKEGKFVYQVGFNFNYENDDFPDHKNVHLYPVLKGTYVINKKTGMSLLAGVGGGMERTSFNETVNQNPFLNSNLVLINENTKISLYGGIEGKLAKYFTYNLTLAYKNYENLSLFMNDELDVSRFNIEYDNGNSGLFRTKGELYFSKVKKVQFGLVAQYDKYSMANYSKAFHRPTFTGNFISKYKIKDNFYLTADVYYLSGLFAYDYVSAEEIKLSNIADLNIGAEYFMNDKFSVFGNFNNLLNKSYERFRNYNVKKLNFIVGFSYAF
jgi:hypothetical protein